MKLRRFLRRFALLTALLAVMTSILRIAPPTRAEVGVDIRSVGRLSASDETVAYAVALDDCSTLSSLVVQGATSSTPFSRADAQPAENDSDGCVIPFELSGDSRFAPSIRARFSDGTEQAHSEAFVAESNAPQIGLDALSFAQIAGKQNLIVRVRANDDTDLAYVNLSVVGLRASDLRAAGGVIERAASTAFATSSGTRRLVPLREGQDLFTLALPVRSELDSAAIANDGLVLIEGEAIDASGNRAAFSKIALTGSDIVETASELSVRPERVLFTNMLETVTLIPSVEFQFRGLTPLPGAGQGVGYRSSNPELVGVTPSGVLYPLAETAGQAITITVTYPGLSPVVVPVEIDPTKSLVSLRATGLDTNGRLVLPALHEAVELPEIHGVFSDGTETAIASQFPLETLVPASSQGVLELRKDTVLARAAISDDAPLTLTVRLKNQPSIALDIPVVARDALPSVSLTGPGSATVGSALRLVAEAKDDVRVREVQFLLNGGIVARREQEPFELTLEAAEELVGQKLTFKAIVIDSAGQSNESLDKTVSIVEERPPELGNAILELPRDLTRVVEGAPFTMQVTLKTDGGSPTGVTHVGFYLDGELLGEARYPRYELRDVGEGSEHYELWQLDGTAPPTSTLETSLPVVARVYRGPGPGAETATRFIRLLDNRPPQIAIKAPADKSYASVGQTLSVSVEVTDDMMSAGEDLSLFVGDKLAATGRVTVALSSAQSDHTAVSAKATHVFALPITSDMLGRTLALRAEARDHQGITASTEAVRVSIRGDQPPSIAIANPISGGRVVSGAPLEIRANASDDIQVTRVDFYVEDRLVGADTLPPFAVAYETPAGLALEQPMRIHAIAKDSGGHETRSAEVVVTVGKDEEPPVVNIASPAITDSEGGQEIARVTEETQFIVKATGFDNVDVTRLELRGVQRQGNRFVLTGEPSHVLTGSDFAPQPIDADLRAFSALKLVHAPPKSGAPSSYDGYPLQISAWDKAGNASTTTIIVGVQADKAPKATAVRADRPLYFARDVATLFVQAVDDVAVASVEGRFYVDGASTAARTITRSASPAGANVQVDFALDLRSLSLSNAAHTIVAEFTATDDKGKPSAQPLVYELDVVGDEFSPKAGISSPLQGSTLFRGDPITFTWKAVDESRLATLRVRNGATTVFSRELTASTEAGEFTYTAPLTGDALELTLVVTDEHDNESLSTWRYTLGSDSPPSVSIRTPASGVRIVEGEPLTLSALVRDNRGLGTVTARIEQAGAVLFQQDISAAAKQAMTKGEYVTLGLRAPHKPGQAEDMRLVVHATDDRGQPSETGVDLSVLDDLEAPHPLLSVPSAALSVEAGAQIVVKGSANDNIYVDTITPVLAATDGTETELSFRGLSRKDRVENITAPNPASFGSAVVAQRFYVDFDGQVALPANLPVGAVYQLYLRVRDYGYNVASTEKVAITIKGDEIAPIIRIGSPAESVFEETAVQASITITDNHSVASYRVRIEDADGQHTLLSEQGLSVSSKTASAPIDISDYDPNDEDTENDVFVLVVEATDASGNSARASRTVTVKPDQAPKIALSDVLPAEQVTRGGLSRQTYTLTDDYVAQSAGFAVYTSFKGLRQGEPRGPKGEVLGTTILSPAISFAYPEAANVMGGTLFVNGEPYLATVDGRLRISPPAGSIQDLRFAPEGTGLTVEYVVEAYLSDYCAKTVRVAKVIAGSTGGGSVPAGTLNVTDLGAGTLMWATLKPRVKNAQGQEVKTFLDTLRLDAADLAQVPPYTGPSGSSRTPTREPLVTAFVVDASDDTGFAMLAAQPKRSPSTFTTAIPVPVYGSLPELSILAHAIDRFASRRGPVNLAPLSIRRMVRDAAAPSVVITAPVDGATVVPRQRFDVQVTASDDHGLASLQLLVDGNPAQEIGAAYGVDKYKFAYEVPANASGSELELVVIAKDQSGAAATSRVALSLAPNVDPELELLGFSTTDVDTEEPSKLARNEFWVRQGDAFGLSVELRDDAGLSAFHVYRLTETGERAEQVHAATFDRTCPSLPLLRATAAVQATLTAFAPTQYELVATDTAGRESSRTVLVRPLTNLAPEIRITAPAPNQLIVAGTFSILVEHVVADDRPVPDQGIELYVNGVRLQANGSANQSSSSTLREQAFASIYDSIEQRYSVELANAYGRKDSPHSRVVATSMQVPSGLVRLNEPVRLTAIVRDSDGAIGRHEITYQAAADAIRPEIALLAPEIGFGPREGSDFSVSFRAFDNVKVEAIELYTAYGAREGSGAYKRQPFVTPRRVIQDIPALDDNLVTTNNVDTPVYNDLVGVARLSEIAAAIPGLEPGPNTSYDIWLKFLVRDASGNTRETELSLPVRIDEKPVIDVVAPLDGARVVEGTPLLVNVNTFDDVGLDNVRLVARRAGQVVTELRLRQPPYQFIVNVPARIAGGDNALSLSVEAVDTYGTRFGQLDNHTATETVTVDIVADQPPTVAIGLPADNADVIEGKAFVAQVNAIDDFEIERVVLELAGLPGGTRSLVDVTFPYEFLVDVPYGQAGTTLTLSAIATERRVVGNPRSASTVKSTRVRIVADSEPPRITVRAPAASGATAVERRELRYEAEVVDAVKVSIVTVDVLADIDGDGTFASTERIAQRILPAPPYAGTIPLQTIAQYLGTNPPRAELPLEMVFGARDGAGNQSEPVSRFITLQGNAPPQVSMPQILDRRGYSLGTISEITEGRGIVVNVIASDREVGVASARLEIAQHAEGQAPVFRALDEDVQAPFQFQVEVPLGSVGQMLSFRAHATDVDGYTSAPSPVRSLRILADKPPVARIAKPDGNDAVIIDGQDLEVIVEVDDDLGADGVDRVVFYVNGAPSGTVYNSISEITGSAAQQNAYRALLTPPEDVEGFEIYAVAFDVRGNSGRTSTVRVGRVEDTVAPRLSVLVPADGAILTQGEAIEIRASVGDIGEANERHVIMKLTREFTPPFATSPTTLAQREIELAPITSESDPQNDYYMYGLSFADGSVLIRGDQPNERVRIETRVVTANHETKKTTYHEVGLPTERNIYWSTVSGANTAAKSVYYTAIDQYRGPTGTGALIGAWASWDALRVEPGLGNATDAQAKLPRTGLFFADQSGSVDEHGDSYLFSSTMLGASDMFTGTITEVFADQNLVLAGKTGSPITVPATLGEEGDAPFAYQLGTQHIGPGSGDLYLDNQDGELLLFTVSDTNGALALPYTLAGRVDMPFKEVLGVARKDGVVLVANGLGGVQVIDISRLNAPYHVGFIKPNGYARDVAVYGRFAVIAASHEGVVIADLRDPSMPIVGKLDTLGVATRLFIEGSKLYVTDMSGEGLVSQLNVIELADPFNPKLLRTVELKPARPDFVEDGVFDVTVSGGKAYVTVHYSDQEDRPAQSLVEVVDLGVDNPNLDATVPVLTHAEVPEGGDFAARGLVFARGALHVAAGKQGVARVELPSLTVVAHTPAQSERDVPTDLASVLIELSSPLAPATDLASYVIVNERALGMGPDVTSTLFDVAFAERDGEDARRFIELKRKATAHLATNTPYVVTLRGTLRALTGLPLGSDYSFEFITSRAGEDERPDIAQVEPNFGSVEGGTEVIVYGSSFGASPELYVGGQRLNIDRVQAGDPEGTGTETLDRIYATTVPNYAGPASVRVVAENGLEDEVLGAFTYVDLLYVSFIDPAVVRVSQSGAGDEVNIVGYGFSDDIVLRAWKRDDRDSVETFTVDDDALSLYSSERMTWVVSNFGDSYRGFVDVELEDSEGRRFYVPNALFYGRLARDRRLEPALSKPATGVATTLLPPGNVVDVAVDSKLDLIYVLGSNPNTDGAGSTPQEVERLQVPSWISLVHYERSALGDAAPMYGLGYFDMPPALRATKLALAEKHVYVAAAGRSYPNVDVPYEGKSWILAYDREDRLPGENGQTQTLGKDRDILYGLELPLTHAPRSLAVAGDLLFAGSPDGLAVIGLANPARPSVLRVIKQLAVDGVLVPLSFDKLHVIGTNLYATADTSVNGSRVTYELVFDITKPSLPLLGKAGLGGAGEALTADGKRLVRTEGPLALTLFDVSRPPALTPMGSFDPRGFALSIPGGVPASAAAQNTVAAHASLYFSVFDSSRPELITLLDALRLEADSEGKGVHTSVLTDEGFAVLAYPKAVDLVDTLTQEITHSEPPQGDLAVPPNDPIKLTFALPFDATSLEAARPYIALAREDGSVTGQVLASSLSIDPSDAHTLILTPASALSPETSYRVQLSGDLPSRRTVGLMEYRIAFRTAKNGAVRPKIVSISPRIVSTQGGQLEVVVAGGEAATSFTLAGAAVSVASSETLSGGQRRYVLNVPASPAGPASLVAIQPSGPRAERVGAVEYVRPLVLSEISPVAGSVNGGTLVTITGQGLSNGTDLQVWFGDIEADPDDVHVLDPETISVRTPAGRLGPVDVRVTLGSGEAGTLREAFEYQQPVQSTISHARVWDMLVDPTGTYLITAAGPAGVVIYNIDSSTHAGTLNEDALLGPIDQNGDGIDDRVVAQVGVPGSAYGVDTYFERGLDRLVVSGASGAWTEGSQGSGLYIVGFDSDNIENSSVVGQVPLFSRFARGVSAENGRAAVAMADGGIGIVDIFLQPKPYLVDSFRLPDGHEALDVEDVRSEAARGEIYAVTSGRYDLAQQLLLDEEDLDTGSFYLVEHDAREGFTILGSVAVPASRVAIEGDYAYLAAGSAGLVAVDISDPRDPVVVSRSTGVGEVNDVAVRGRTVYAASDRYGIVVFDMTDPAAPKRGPSMALPGDTKVVAANAYTGIGSTITGQRKVPHVQVVPDVTLKVHEVDPASGILDQGALSELTVRLRFNKAIDEWPENLTRFGLYDAAGRVLPSSVEIVSNDAILTLLPGHGLEPGDGLQAIARAGVASVKWISSTVRIPLYTLRQDQVFPLLFRGAAPRPLDIDAVVPRRLPLGFTEELTISLRGAPESAEQLRVFVGGVEATVLELESEGANEASAIATVLVPAMHVAGQYDVVVSAQKAGVDEIDTLRGGVVIDEPIRFDSATPAWGPISGGTTITIVGEGFEPGNTVTESLRVRIGDVPARSVRVLSRNRIEVVSASGRTGRHVIHGEDRYANSSELDEEHGFGYGLKQIGNQTVSFYPEDIYVDRQTGIAITNGGKLSRYEWKDKPFAPDPPYLRKANKEPFPDNILLASFDVQEPTKPVLVGAAPALPSGADGERMIREVVAAAKQSATSADLPESKLNVGLDGLGFDVVEELERDPADPNAPAVLRKRLYLANGVGTVSRINLDEQNGRGIL